VSGEVLTARALNRALLERQGLLARQRTTPMTMVERLVGMQAQVPENPYVALWSRLAAFAPEDLSGAIERRAAVRAQLMRATIHLVSARDCLAFHPITAEVLAKVFRPPWLAGLAGADVGAVVAAGMDALAEEPRTRADLAALLAPRWPGADPLALAYAVTYNAPLVQVPPRGRWRATGRAAWAPAEAFLGAPLAAEPDVDAMIHRYLAAFGPATVADIRTWSGLTGLRAVVERLRPRLRAFRDEGGRELLDVEDGRLPDLDTPAPVRFLPEYDNVALAHADRSRLFAGTGPGAPLPRGGRAIGTLLVDGFHRANWQIAADGATLTVDRFVPLPGDPPGSVEAIVAEGEALLAFMTPEAGERRVVFAPPVA
jgi:winged helix DNA-binding protein